MTTIGLFGPADDQEVGALAERLRHRGAEPWVVDLGAFPSRLSITSSAGDGEGVMVGGRPLLEMHAAFLRRLDTGLPEHLRYDEPAPALDADGWRRLLPGSIETLQAARRAQVVRTAVVRTLERRRTVINPADSQNLHRLKAHMLWRLRRAGLPVPDLAAGSDRGALATWALRAGHRCAAVDKPVAGVYKTRAWTEEGHAARPWATRPALVQRYVEGDTIRCYVLDGEVLAAARILHDGRHVDSSIAQTGVEVLELTPEAQGVALGAARSLKLAFCGLDLLIRQGGEVFLIDCNLSPMFVNHGRMCRCDIAGHLADHLIACAGRGEARRRPAVLGMVDQVKALLASDPDLRLSTDRRRGDG